MSEQPLNNKAVSGFTLIELIAAMLIVGVIAGFSLLFLMNSAAGFVTAQQNAVLVQKARLTIARLTAEFFREMKTVAALSPAGNQKTYIKYIYQYAPQKDRQVSLVGAGLRKKIVILDSQTELPAESDDEVLADHVSSFSMVFEKCDGTSWDIPDDMEDLCRIEILLELFKNKSDSDTLTFGTTITLPSRNPVVGVIGSDTNDTA